MRSKIWIVTKFEIIRQLKKPSFWIALLLMPVFMLGIVGLSAMNGYNADAKLEESWNNTEYKIALTDNAGLLGGDADVDFSELGAGSAEPERRDPVTTGVANASRENYISVVDKEAGIAAVKNGDIDIYYFIPENFAESPTIELYAKSKDDGLFANYEIPLRNLLMSTSVGHLNPNDLIIVTNGYNFTSTTFNQDGEEVNIFGRALIPMAILAIFYLLICVFGNRLTMAVVEEKENRISEMILTAVSAKDLIIGKIIALITLGFIQIAVFIIPTIAIIFIYRDNEIISQLLSIIEVNPFIIVTSILLLLFSYFLFTGLCTLVGSLVPTARDASQYIGVVMLPLVSSAFFIGDFMSTDPNFMVYFLSYFPLSAPIALMLRNAFGTLPPHELVIALIELAICSAVVIRWTVKSFRKNAINFSVVKPNFGIRKSWKKR